MAKQNAAARRKAARRVKKNVERGQAHIQSSFNNDRYSDRRSGQRSQLGKCRRSWIQRFKEIYSLRSTDGSRDSYQGCTDSWT